MVSRPYIKKMTLYQRIARGLILDLQTGCWLWIGATDGKGYAKIYQNGKLVPVQAWKLKNIERVRKYGRDSYHRARKKEQNDERSATA